MAIAIEIKAHSNKTSYSLQRETQEVRDMYVEHGDQAVWIPITMGRFEWVQHATRIKTRKEQTAADPHVIDV